MFDILESCTYYPIDLELLDSKILEKIKDEYGIDESDKYITLDGVTIDDLNINSEAIRYESADFDKISLEDILESYIGKHPYYLVFASGCRWNGASGYKITSNIIDTVLRDYEISLYYISHIEDRALICKESSHDVPMGSETFIIGISEDEYEKLEDFEFDEIEEFVNNIVK